LQKVGAPGFEPPSLVFKALVFKATHGRITIVCRKSGRRDLNPGPHGPEPCTLAGLSYAPFVVAEKLRIFALQRVSAFG
jgi:hypothetical protein